MITCPNKNSQEWRDLVAKVGETKAYVLWNNDNIINNNTESVDYNLKAVNILQSDKAKQVFEKGKKNNWDLNKILTELQIPKEQKQIILDKGFKVLTNNDARLFKNGKWENNDNLREEIITSLLADNSFVVEINTAKTERAYDSMYDSFRTGFNFYEENGKYYKENLATLDSIEITKQEYEDNVYKKDKIYTSYYSNLTVPGGTNYTENEISTPLITPIIKGHAKFATDNGIGWFRSDDKTKEGTGRIDEWDDDKNQRVVQNFVGGEPTKTRRILEVQSDLFQKGRDRQSLAGYKSELSLEEEQFYNRHLLETGQITQEEFDNPKITGKDRENQFLQLLNKDNNWVAFFVKSIIQDSAKKGYEKVLFPSGDTASKVEGHSTLEDFKKQKEDRIKELENNTIPEWQNKKDNFIPENYFNINMFNSLSEEEKKNLIQKERVKLNQEINSFYAEIEQLKQELERVETEGFAALRPIYNFYENTVTNILKKQGYNPVEITDEYGNTWNEVTLVNTDLSVDLSPLSLNEETQKQLKENTPKSLLIQGITINTQNTIVNHLFSKFLKLYNKEKDSKKAFQYVKQDFFEEIKIAIKVNEDALAETKDLRYQKRLNVLNAIKNNYGTIRKTVAQKLKAENNLVVNFSKRTIKELDSTLKNTEEELDEDAIYELDFEEQNNWESDDTFKENIKEKMSVDLKNFFSYIEDLVEDEGNLYPKKGILGINEVVSKDIVINDLNAILAFHNNVDETTVLEPTFENMEKVIEAWTDKKPYLHNVLEELDKASDKIKNEFVQVMSKHYTNHVYIYEDSKGETSLRRSDNNIIGQTIQKDWLNNIFTNGLVITDKYKEEDIFKIDKQKLKDINNAVEVLINELQTKADSRYTTAKYTLDLLGLEFDTKTTKMLIDNSIKIKGKDKNLLNLLTDADGAIKNYVNTLNEIKEENVLDIDPFKENKSMSDFAFAFGKMFPIYFANAFKDVRGKGYFGYSNNKFFIDRYKDLITNSNLLEKLKKQPFTTNSSWVNNLYNNLNGIIDANTKKDFLKYFEYFTFDGTASAFKEEGIKLEFSSPAEIEKSKLATFFAKNKYAYKSNKTTDSNYIVNLFYPTTSNKTTQLGLQVLGEEWGKGLINGKLNKTQLNKLINILVAPEVNRILAMQDNPDKYNIKGYDMGSTMFHFIPSLNSERRLWDENGNLRQDVLGDANLKNIIAENLQNYIDVLIADKIKKWEEFGFISTSKEAIEIVDENKKDIKIFEKTFKFSKRYTQDPFTIEKEAHNYVLNYLVGNINIYQTFITDPAFYFKSSEFKNILKNEAQLQQLVNSTLFGDTKEEVKEYFNSLKNDAEARKKLLPFYTKDNWLNEHEDIFNNIGKRLAADAAPGVDLPNSPNDSFTLGYILDSKRSIYLHDYYKSLQGITGKMPSINATDAQEFTTLREHLHILNLQGKIDKKQMKLLLSLENSKQGFTTEQLGVILQPLKPVYVANIWKNGIEQRIYVKSSSFPLIKQMTKGLEIDKLRKAMINQKVDRVAFESAVKVGGTNTGTQIYKDSTNDLNNIGKLNDNIKIDVINTVKRTGWKIQQENPYKANKDNINDGTQQIKLLTANLRYEKGFKLYGESKTFTGQQIQDKIDEAYNKLFEIQYNELIEEVGYDAFENTIDIAKLSKTLQTEALQRNYPLHEVESLRTKILKDGTEDFVVPLWATGVSGKIEAMLNSIVNNRVRKIKPKGYSYILGTSEGFRPQETTTEIQEGEKAQETINNTTGIIWDKDWYSTNNGQLNPMRILDKNGKLPTDVGFDSESSYVAYAEILVPFNFKDNKGNPLSVDKFTKDGFIDTSLLTPELLNIFGFRIPTQGLSSMSAIKIVGFLPSKMGDLMLAPADFTLQMGSDFDVDKLYTNSYNTNYENGKLQRYTNKVEDKKVLENQILDLHFSVLGHEKVQKAILKPLDFGNLKELAEEIYEYNKPEIRGIGLSETYQTWKYLNARAGKAGIGVFSTDLTFMSQIQNKDIYLQIKTDKGYRKYIMKVGNKKANELSEYKTIDRSQFKTDNITALQSLSVDDENEQGLFKLNVNNTTFDAIRTLVMSGYSLDTIMYLINQPIIRTYTELKIKATDSVVDFRENQIELEIEKAYPITDTEFGLNNSDFWLKYNNFSDKDLLNNIKNKEAADSNIQRVIYEIFKEASAYGKNIQYVQSAINTHSAGFGKDLFYSTTKANQVLGLEYYGLLANTKALIGDYFTFKKLDNEAIEKLEKVDNPLIKKLVQWNKTDNPNIKKDIIEDLIKLGYKAVTPVKTKNTINDTIRFIKPTTIAGSVSVNALFLNNALWSKFFPYENIGVNNAVDSVISVLTDSNTEARLSTQAVNKRKAFDILKSFIIAKNYKVYTDGELIAERKRLLLDTKNADGTIANSSIATIIFTLKKLGKLNNSFINALNFDIKSTVLPSTITYQASKVENLDEKHLHTAVSNMLLDNTTDLGTFNGINYTPQKIMQDLITQQLLSGGLQKATQIIKYIPIHYLNTIGFYDTIRDTNFENQQEINPIYLQNQVVQHNPKKVVLSKLEKETLTKYYNFYNKKTLIKAKENIPLKALMPKIFSFTNENGEYKLYFYNETSKGWEQKDILGNQNIKSTGKQNQIDEYDASVPFGKSIIVSNQIPVVDVVDIPVTPKEVKERLDTTPLPSTSPDIIFNVEDVTLEEYYDLFSPETTKDKVAFMLNRIITGNNSDAFAKLMAKQLLKNLDKIANYEIIITSLISAEGSHSLKDKTIKLNPSVHKSKEAFEKTILEELIHASTKQIIIDNNTGEMARLTSTYNTAVRGVKAYITNELKQDADNAFETVINKLKDGTPLTKFEYDTIYPVINEVEFVGRLFKSKQLQEILNNSISDVTGKSIFEDILDFIIDVLQQIGIIKDSALDYAVKDIISLINMPNPTETQLNEANKSQKIIKSVDYVNKEFGLLNEDGTYKAFEDTDAKKLVNFINNTFSNLKATQAIDFVVVKSIDKYNIPIVLDIKAKGKMTYAYNNNKRNDIKATTTIEAIKNGERTATTRYESDGNIEYWKSVKKGDIIEWEGANKEKVLVEVTKPLHKLIGSGKNVEQWSKLEGWSIDYFNAKVKPKIQEAWQLEYKLISTNTNNQQGQLELDLSPIQEDDSKVNPNKSNVLLKSYNNRIKEINKNIDIAENEKNYSKVEQLKELLEIVTEKRNETITITSLRNRSKENSDLYYKGLQDLQEVETMLNGSRNITVEDTIYIRKILHFWEKSTEILFTEEDKQSQALLNDFMALQGRAEALEDILIKEEEKYINTFIKKYGHTTTVKEIFQHFQDINGWTASTLDISHAGNEILSSIFLALKNADIDALDEGNKLLENLDEMESKVLSELRKMNSKEPYDVFAQKFDNGKPTGHLVTRYTNSFRKSYNIRLNQLYKTNNATSFTGVLSWAKENLEVVNLKYLLFNNLSKEEQEKAEIYKNELKAKLGQKHYEDFLNEQTQKFENYNKKRESKLQNILDKYKLNSIKEINNSEYAFNEFQNWEAVNSPIKFYQYVASEEGLPEKYSNFKNFNNTSFIALLPKKDTAYDENFKQIENNETLYEFYKYYQNIDRILKDKLPADVARNLTYTGIPYIKKTIFNLFQEKGMKFGLKGVYDNVIKSIRSVEESVVNSKNIDPVTNKSEDSIKLSLTNNDSEIISKYASIKAIEYKAETGENATADMVAKWRQEKIEELASLKSFDLAKILKVYTMTVLAYNHKAKIENMVKLAQNVINEQKEPIRNNAGEIQKDENLVPLTPKSSDKSFVNTKAQLQYFIDANLYGKTKNEIVKGKIIYTKEEKEEIAEIEEVKVKLASSLKNNTITQEDYDSSINILDEHIKSLGGVRVVSKVGDAVLKWVQLVKMGWNIMSSIANVGFGYIANRIEASGGEFYTNAQLTEAYKLTSHSIFKNATFNKGETATAKKIRSLMDKWNVLKDATHEMFQRPLDLEINKSFKFLSPYNVTQRTEYVNQAPIVIAILLNTPLRDLSIDIDGNLWEAYDENGNWKTDKFGAEPDVEQSQAIKNIRIKIDTINALNHGNYDPTRSLMLKKTLGGRAVAQFRTWMFEAIEARFGKEKPDSVLGIRKGRYRSGARFFLNNSILDTTTATLKGLTRSLTLGTVFNSQTFEEYVGADFSKKDAANMRKLMTEISMYTTIFSAYIMLKAIAEGLDDEEDKEAKWVLTMLINQGSRLKTDIAFYADPRELKNLTRDLVPAMSLITDFYNFTDAVFGVLQGKDEIQAGVHKGNSRILRATSQLIPIGTHIYKTYNYGSQIFDK